jgi:adenosylcobinamide-GDP ribazoletransferase
VLFAVPVSGMAHKTWLRPLHLAHTFLTTLPLPHVGEVKDGEFKVASGYYPAVGWTLGVLLCVGFWLVSSLPGAVGAGLLLALWMGLTGMLHFDGLVDCGDALLAAKPAAKRLEILSDVHMGAFGLGVGVVHLLLKWSALSQLEVWLPLLLAPVLARAALLIPMNLWKSARPESLGAKSKEGNWGMGLLFAAPAVLLAPWLALAAVLAALLVAWFAASRLGGGISGDVYGAIVEVCEVAVLVVALL